MREARTEQEVEAAVTLRERVFVGEQGVPLTADRDGRDREAVHVVAVSGGQVVGTCRLLIEGGLSRLGRMAVERPLRGAGLGARLLAEAEQVSLRHGATRVRLHAQLAARGLYERAGYVPEGEVFIEEDIEHLTMEKALA